MEGASNVEGNAGVARGRVEWLSQNPGLVSDERKDSLALCDFLHFLLLDRETLRL